MLPTKFQVNWPFGSGEEVKNRLSRWPQRLHAGFQIVMILAIFDLRQPNASFQVSSQLAFQFRRRSEQQIFKMAPMAAIMDFY